VVKRKPQNNSMSKRGEKWF